MKNSFKVRVVENIGSNSQRLFGEVGNVISITDGRFEDLEGSCWYCDSYEDIINSFSDHDCFETKFELLEEYYMECKFKIGDMVKVIDVGETYTSYDEFVYKKCNQYEDNFITGDMPSTEETYQVIYYSKYLDNENNEPIVVIQDLDTDQIYLISQEGLKLSKCGKESDDNMENINLIINKPTFNKEVIKQFQSIKIKGEFDYVYDDKVTAIITRVTDNSINIIYCDDDLDEETQVISIDDILNGKYEIIKIYK